MNRIIKLIFLIAVLSLVSCKDNQLIEEHKATITSLEILKAENKNLLSQIENRKVVEGDMIHYVFLDVKDDVSEKQYEFLIDEIKSLASISGVKDFKVGLFENMDDDRAIIDRDINFEMRFKEKKDYYSYQKSKSHSRVRQALAPYLVKAPLTYDYLIQ